MCWHSIDVVFQFNFNSAKVAPRPELEETVLWRFCRYKWIWPNGCCLIIAVDVSDAATIQHFTFHGIESLFEILWAKQQQQHTRQLTSVSRFELCRGIRLAWGNASGETSPCIRSEKLVSSSSWCKSATGMARMTPSLAFPSCDNVSKVAQPSRRPAWRPSETVWSRRRQWNWSPPRPGCTRPARRPLRARRQMPRQQSQPLPNASCRVCCTMRRGATASSEDGDPPTKCKCLTVCCNSTLPIWRKTHVRPHLQTQKASRPTAGLQRLNGCPRQNWPRPTPTRHQPKKTSHASTIIRCATPQEAGWNFSKVTIDALARIRRPTEMFLRPCFPWSFNSIPKRFQTPLCRLGTSHGKKSTHLKDLGIQRCKNMQTMSFLGVIILVVL